MAPVSLFSLTVSTVSPLVSLTPIIEILFPSPPTAGTLFQIIFSPPDFRPLFAPSVTANSNVTFDALTTFIDLLSSTEFVVSFVPLLSFIPPGRPSSDTFKLTFASMLI